LNRTRLDDKPFPGNGDEADRAENGRILLDALSASPTEREPASLPGGIREFPQDPLHAIKKQACFRSDACSRSARARPGHRL